MKRLLALSRGVGRARGHPRDGREPRDLPRRAACILRTKGLAETWSRRGGSGHWEGSELLPETRRQNREWVERNPLPLPSRHLGPPPPSGPTQTEASPDRSPGEAAAGVRLQGHKEGTKKQRIDPARVGASQGTQDHQPAYL